MMLRWLLAFFFTAGGIAHLYAPDKLLLITPAWVPYAREAILATGVLEIAGSVALLTRPLRKWAGVAFALYALCVWPANIKQALDGIVVPPLPDSWWYHGPRLAFQPLIVWASLYASRAIDWPFQRADLHRHGRLVRAWELYWPTSILYRPSDMAIGHCGKLAIKARRFEIQASERSNFTIAYKGAHVAEVLQPLCIRFSERELTFATVVSPNCAYVRLAPDHI